MNNSRQAKLQSAIKKLDFLEGLFQEMYLIGNISHRRLMYSLLPTNEAIQDNLETDQEIRKHFKI